MIKIDLSKSSLENLIDALEAANPDAKFKLSESPELYELDVITEGIEDGKFAVQVVCDDDAPMLTSPELEFTFTPVGGELLLGMDRVLKPTNMDEFEETMEIVLSGAYIELLIEEMGLPEDQFRLEHIPASGYTPDFIAFHVGHELYPLVKLPTKTNTDINWSEREEYPNLFGFYVVKPEEAPPVDENRLIVVNGYGDEIPIEGFVEHTPDMDDIADISLPYGQWLLIPSKAYPGSFILRLQTHTYGGIVKQWGNGEHPELGDRKLVGVSFSRETTHVDINEKSLPDWAVSGEYLFYAMYNGGIPTGTSVENSSYYKQKIDWDTSKLTSTHRMFSNSYITEDSFRQYFGEFDLTNVIDASNMFDGTAFSGNDTLDLSIFKFEAVENMDEVFQNAIGNGYGNTPLDASKWCVKNIPSEPKNFELESEKLIIKQPKWGTCPGGELPNEEIGPDLKGYIDVKIPIAWTEPTYSGDRYLIRSNRNNELLFETTYPSDVRHAILRNVELGSVLTLSHVEDDDTLVSQKRYEVTSDKAIEPTDKIDYTHYLRWPEGSSDATATVTVDGRGTGTLGLIEQTERDSFTLKDVYVGSIIGVTMRYDNNKEIIYYVRVK